MLRKLRYALRRMPIADSQARSVRHDCGAVTRCDDSQGCQPPIERPRLASARALSDAWAPATEPGAAQHSTVHPARIAPWWLGFPHASVRACTCNCARGICACADVWYVCAACAILWFGGFTAHGNARGQSTCACARRIAFGVYGRPGDFHGRFQPPSGLPSPQGCRSQCGRRARVQPWCCRFCTEHSGGQRSGGVWQEQCRSLDRRWHVDVHTHWVRLHRRRSCKAASKAILHTHLATAHHARSTAPPCLGGPTWGAGRGEIFETSPNFAKRCNMMRGDPRSAAEPSEQLHQHVLTVYKYGTYIFLPSTVRT